MLLEATSHGDEPASAAAGDVDDPAPAGQPGRQLGQRREGLLEEDGDVLGGHGLDRPVEARRSLGDRSPGPEVLDHAARSRGC